MPDSLCGIAQTRSKTESKVAAHRNFLSAAKAPGVLTIALSSKAGCLLSCCIENGRGLRLNLIGHWLHKSALMGGVILRRTARNRNPPHANCPPVILPTRARKAKFARCATALAPRIQRHTLDTSPILLPLLLREKEIPIELLCTKGPRDVTSYRDPCNPKVSRKSSAEQIHRWMSSLEELFRKRRVCDDVCEVRRSEPFDVAGAEIPKNVVKAGRRFAANDVA